MHFPKYWARGEWNGTNSAGKPWHQLAWDCSDESADDARTRAQAKAQRLGQSAGSQAWQRDAYPYADRALREPVLRRLNESDSNAAAVITRTAYGSEVLNSAGLMFIDIDLPQVQSGPSLLELLKRLFIGASSKPIDSNSPDSKLNALRQWQAVNSSWGFRAYRTHSGMRYLVTSGWRDPVAEDTHAIFASLGCDTRYRQLCKVQKSFRARLTPKPWRCGCPNPPVRFPFENADSERKMNDWIARYEDASQRYATCQFLATVGSTMPPAEISPLIAEHDARTKATSGLPLA
jgi:hypothetical protein